MDQPLWVTLDGPTTIVFPMVLKEEEGKKEQLGKVLRFCDKPMDLDKGISKELGEEEQVFVVACELWVSSLFLCKFCYVLLVEK